jgi:predicted AAA+ superfamily ATPase
MIERTISGRIAARLFKGRVITLLGARRVGKTTLVKALLQLYSDKRVRYLNCDLQSVQLALSLSRRQRRSRPIWVNRISSSWTRPRTFRMLGAS